MHGHTTVQIKSSGQIDSGGKVYFVIRSTVRKSLLECGSIQCFAITHGIVGFFRYIDAVPCR